MVSGEEIVTLHDRLTTEWHGQPVASPATAAQPLSAARQIVPSPEADWLQAVTRQHRSNFDLWHIEDEARAPGATDAEIAQLKRRIDKTNQLRNDLIEELDCVLLGWLEQRGLPKASAPLNSEPPGMIVDRLSILALKIYHTREEAGRADAPDGHRLRNQERLTILEGQRAALLGCLDTLWKEILSGNRSFAVYRQLKMYNDPSLNPAIYKTTAVGNDR